MYGFQQGFDIVIGNPPYVRQEAFKEDKPSLKPHYPHSYNGTADLYVYFYERSFQLLKPSGCLSFITSNKWFRSKYGAPLRVYMVTHTEMRQIIDFGDEAVFDALAYPTIVIATKRHKPVPLSEVKNDVYVLNWDSKNEDYRVNDFPEVFAAECFGMPQNELKPDGWQLELPIKRRLLARLLHGRQSLGAYCNERFYYGIKTGLNAAFDISRRDRDSMVAGHPASASIIKPFLRGKDVKRWNVEFGERYLIKIESSENLKHPWSGLPSLEAEKVFADIHPTIYAWFTANDRRQQLIDRTDQGHYFWELRSCAYWEYFEKPKIILARFMNQPTYAWDDKGTYMSNGSSMIAGADQFVVAVLNSAVAWWFLKATSTDLAGGFLQAHNYNQFSIPIPAASETQKSIAIALVEAIRSDVSRPEYERLLNGLVYELFFPEDLHAKNIYLFDACTAAGIREGMDAQAIATEVFHPRHTIYGQLFELQTLEVVQLIES
jgi:adenine-specific DNA-methyltransferase